MLPVQLQRAMAAEAEAAREARAKVIAAEGERDASESLKEAAKVIQRSPQALQVLYNVPDLYIHHSDHLVAVSADSELNICGAKLNNYLSIPY